jgi:hypothetical protein
VFKLQASGLVIDGIPLATSDDHTDRKMIMEIAAQKARKYYRRHEFEHVVYLGDGPWDWLATRSLGYGFIGIGPRVQALCNTENINWHRDFREVEAVLASIASIFNYGHGIGRNCE